MPGYRASPLPQRVRALGSAIHIQGLTVRATIKVASWPHTARTQRVCMAGRTYALRRAVHVASTQP